MTGYLYAIDAGDAVKIGWSANPERRLSKISSDNHNHVRLIGCVRATREQEQHIHGLLSRWRIRREWYRREGGVLILLDKIPPSPARRRKIKDANTPRNPIRAYRDARRLSLDELAAEIGVKRNTIWRWENGRVPERRMWPAIQKATGLTPTDLIRIAEAA